MSLSQRQPRSQPRRRHIKLGCWLLTRALPVASRDGRRRLLWREILDVVTDSRRRGGASASGTVERLALASGDVGDALACFQLRCAWRTSESSWPGRGAGHDGRPSTRSPRSNWTKIPMATARRQRRNSPNRRPGRSASRTVRRGGTRHRRRRRRLWSRRGRSQSPRTDRAGRAAARRRRHRKDLRWPLIAEALVVATWRQHRKPADDVARCSSSCPSRHCAVAPRARRGSGAGATRQARRPRGERHCGATDRRRPGVIRGNELGRLGEHRRRQRRPRRRCVAALAASGLAAAADSTGERVAEVDVPVAPGGRRRAGDAAGPARHGRTSAQTTGAGTEQPRARRGGGPGDGAPAGRDA